LETLEKIKACDTMPKLDDLRKESVVAMLENNGVNFTKIQNAFIKQKNKLSRIPLKDRTW